MTPHRDANENPVGRRFKKKSGAFVKDGDSVGGLGVTRAAALLCAIICALLTSCGGGDDSSSGSAANVAPVANVVPVAAVSGPVTAYSSQRVTLDARGSRDPDGRISSQQWTQLSGPTIQLQDAGSLQPSFTAPPVDGPVAIGLRLRVVDDGGASASIDIDVAVRAADVQIDVVAGNGARFVVDDQSVPLLVRALTFEGRPVSPATLEWRSNVQGSLSTTVVVGSSRDVSLRAATHTLTLIANCGELGTVRRSVDLPVLPRQLEIPAFQAAPATGNSVIVPVVAVTYVPTIDGVTLDTSEAPYAFRPPEWSGNRIADILRYTTLLSGRVKYFAEERSRFRGYKSANAAPYLGYRVVAHYVYYEPLRRTTRQNPFNPGQTMVDVADTVARIDGERRVNQEGLREVWLFAYFDERLQLWESNMSSPVTGDVSNSDGFVADLPVYARSYVLYGYNYHRTQAEAIHNHLHQMERMLGFAEQRRSGNVALFWRDFVGYPNGLPPGGQQMALGRCGWTHMPPNTSRDYDYTNTTEVLTDCEDWRPDGSGARRLVNSAYFGALPYAWPEGNAIPQKDETQFYLWWMQNMPGANNTISAGARGTMRNWWELVADWDGSILRNASLTQQ